MCWGYVLLKDGLIHVCYLHHLGNKEVSIHMKVIHPIHTGSVSLLRLENIGSNKSCRGNEQTTNLG